VSAERITLRAGALELQVTPAVGGSIARFDWLGPGGRQPLLRGNDGHFSDVIEAACFPLVPFANRIRGGGFWCGGRNIVLTPNLAGDASPLHGQGWRAAWTVERVLSDAIEMTYRHGAGEWPWTYEAHQRMTLTPGGLSIELRCRNLSALPMPCGLGLHPYYPCDAQTLLDTSVSSAWTIDEAVLPVACVAATGRYSLRNRLICGQRLDNGFDGWTSPARITWPGRVMALALASGDASRFQVYSPGEGGFFVAEPVQNANCALNAPQAEWKNLGIELLAEGESRRLLARFSVGASPVRPM